MELDGATAQLGSCQETLPPRRRSEPPDDAGRSFDQAFFGRGAGGMGFAG